MRLSSSFKVLVAVLLAVSLLLAGCRGGTASPTAPDDPGAPVSQPGGQQPEGESGAGQDAVAIVNGETISVEAFNRELARFEAGRVALGYEVSDQGSYRQQVLNQMIEDVLVRQLAASQGIVVPEDQVDAEINGMIAEYGEEYVENWLAANGLTREEFREKIHIALIWNEFLPIVLEAVPTTAEHVHARHILVNSQSEAEAVLQRIQAGEDFAAVAGEVSTDATTRDRGGDLGWFPRGGLLVPEVEDAAFSMEPGQTSGVIASAWGYHVVQTLEFDPAREVDPETQQRLRQQAIDQWRAQLRANADIQQILSPSG